MRTARDPDHSIVPDSSPAVARAEQLAEALGRIVTGRPLPESLRPTVYAPAPPATAGAGIARILAGPGAGAA